jgi:hypothetical protein
MTGTSGWRWAPTTLLFAVVLMAACSSSTRATTTTIPQYYRVPGHDAVVFKSLLVMGVGEDEDMRRLFENAFAQALGSDGTNAEPSWQRLPQSTLLSAQEIDTAIDAGGFDGVVVTRLVRVDDEREWVEGRTIRVQRARLFEGYYQGSYKLVHEPGYYQGSKTYRLETNLYSVSDGVLVWSAESATVDPKSAEDGIGSMTQTVATKLKEHGLIR